MQALPGSDRREGVKVKKKAVRGGTALGYMHTDTLVLRPQGSLTVYLRAVGGQGKAVGRLRLYRHHREREKQIKQNQLSSSPWPLTVLALRSETPACQQRNATLQRSLSWPVHQTYHGSPLRSAPLDPVQHLFSHQGMLCWRGVALPLYRLALPSSGRGEDEV
ncbi:unnamed protein product [Pleuronectes platessa]|uniref:Uncharacterized protein n=1 Tax=Pleuronectes platessa TaxID=8262 RepID=A0A9N7TUS8_PLEPL|nr:unnamed protein product [Pleuronectes platessa]